MSDYRRLYISGGCYFFTLVTHRRQPVLTGSLIPHLRSALQSALMRMPFRIQAVVILPDHLHCMWSLPPGDADYSRRWQFVKSSFVRRVKRDGLEARLPVWQPRYWEHWLRDEADLQRHLDYIHYNPVKHGYTDRPSDWPWSSFSKYVQRGFYPLDWGTTEPSSVRGLDME